jgi:hypothetical protein
MTASDLRVCTAIVGGGLLLLGLLIPHLFLRLRKPSWRAPEETGTEGAVA